jgi:hypothetical protein
MYTVDCYAVFVSCLLGKRKETEMNISLGLLIAILIGVVVLLVLAFD